MVRTHFCHFTLSPTLTGAWRIKIGATTVTAIPYMYTFSNPEIILGSYFPFHSDNSTKSNFFNIKDKFFTKENTYIYKNLYTHQVHMYQDLSAFPSSSCSA